MQPGRRGALEGTNVLYWPYDGGYNPSTDREKTQHEMQEYTVWANAYLSERGDLPPVGDLVTALSDGITLIKLVEVMAEQQVPYPHPKPTSWIQRVENTTACLSFCGQGGVTLEGVTSSDIVDGKAKAILALCHALRIRCEGVGKYAVRAVPLTSRHKPYHPGSRHDGIDSRGHTQVPLVTWEQEDMAIFAWVKCMLGHMVVDYSVFQDGSLLCRLVNKICEGDMDPKVWMDKSYTDRMYVAMETVERKFGLPCFLDVQTVIRGHGHESLRDYLSQLRRIGDMHFQQKKWREEKEAEARRERERWERIHMKRKEAQDHRRKLEDMFDRHKQQLEELDTAVKKKEMELARQMNVSYNEYKRLKSPRPKPAEVVEGKTQEAGTLTNTTSAVGQATRTDSNASKDTAFNYTVPKPKSAIYNVTDSPKVSGVEESNDESEDKDSEVTSSASGDDIGKSDVTDSMWNETLKSLSKLALRREQKSVLATKPSDLPEWSTDQGQARLEGHEAGRENVGTRPSIQIGRDSGSRLSADRESGNERPVGSSPASALPASNTSVKGSGLSGSANTSNLPTGYFKNAARRALFFASLSPEPTDELSDG
ncbi:interaptin-like [Branchiostoma lanceolatum]|uniref:interaptin-like n=1 Tax=Branchiostoma lanceolatum TaxID=7740 RepID=UPI003451ADDC